RCVAGQALLQVPGGAAAQPGLAEQVDEPVVTVSLHQRVEVEQRADVAAEGDLEEDVPNAAGRGDEAGERERAAQNDVGGGPGEADHYPPVAGLEPCVR